MKKNILFIVVAVLCLFFKANAQNLNTIYGEVVDSATNQPLEGATLKIRLSSEATSTKKKGNFFLRTALPSGTLEVTYQGYVVSQILFNSKDTYPLHIVLSQSQTTLSEVAIVSNGYQNIPKDRATGSFVLIGSALINRSTSPDILDRLNGVTSGLIFTNNGNHQYGQSNIEIRGRATLFSNSNPLIILDNFPYDGDLNNINPNDIQSISVLKDGAAASAWGSRSGNGVIVITTKKGHLNSAPTISFNVNTIIGQKPNLYYTPQLTSSEYIGVEQFLFNKGAFNSAVNNGYSALSPAVQIFLARRNGTISSADSLSMINSLKGADARQQLLKYFYRPSVDQQYQASINGGTASHKYFISAGYDKDLNSLVNSNYDRITLNANNTFYFLKNKLELYTNLVYTGSTTSSGPVYSPQYPYNQIADANGNPTAIANTLRLAYASTAGNGKLLNWLYEPLDELRNGYSNTTAKLTDYRINVSLSYKILNGLKASALYNYEKGITETDNLNQLQSYYTRNLINTFTEINSTTGAVTYPIPLGAIDNTGETNFSSNDGRFQLSYNNAWGKSAVNAVAGSEIDNYTSFNSTYALYGYNPETTTNLNSSVNFASNFPYFYGSTTARINPNTTELGATNRFVSEYFNGSYTYADKYIASISGRRDESNLFGVSENQKGVPLWSAGLSWIASNENFFKVEWLPQFKLRATYGYTGNVNTSVSALLTAVQGRLSTIYNAPYNQIVNPPNPSLRWEKDKNIDLGIDFGLKENRLTGSIDLWRKNGIDLIGQSPVAPQTGITLFTGNSANTSTNGIDVQFNSINLNGKFKWLTTFLYNYDHNIVTSYKVSNGTNYNVVSANYNNPLPGYPYYAIFSFKYAGLTSTGDPQGYLNGKISTDYSDIMNSSNRSELVFSGSATPISFGSLLNTFTYASFDLSFNITYKLGYYFRRTSLNHSVLYSTGGGNYQMADYENRWQKPGDEAHTDVPALIYPANQARTNLYTYSNVLVQNADNIRFQDFRFGYTIRNRHILPFKDLNIFTYINNIGILWRANKYHIDPDYPTGIPISRTFSFGLKTNL
jgi:TonB-linked SusC/RagA family outer membrane protein